MAKPRNCCTRAYLRPVGTAGTQVPGVPGGGLINVGWATSALKQWNDWLFWTKAGTKLSPLTAMSAEQYGGVTLLTSWACVQLVGTVRPPAVKLVILFVSATTLACVRLLPAAFTPAAN